jgi:hypothetical protein
MSPPTRWTGTTHPLAATKPWAWTSTIAKGYTEPGPHQIGRVNKKAIYREYTDATFTTLKPRAPQDEYLGLARPHPPRAKSATPSRSSSRTTPRILTACIRTASLYEKDSEGADYNDGTSGKDKEDGCVAPGATHNYTWRIPDRAGPGPADPSSIFWLYHSHCDELRDVASGLFGGIVVTRRGMAHLPDGRPKDVDREFVTIFIAINENESWYLDDNINEHTTDPKGVKRSLTQSTSPGSSEPSPIPALPTPTSSGPSTDTSTATCP